MTVDVNSPFEVGDVVTVLYRNKTVIGRVDLLQVYLNDDGVDPDTEIKYLVVSPSSPKFSRWFDEDQITPFTVQQEVTP